MRFSTSPSVAAAIQEYEDAFRDQQRRLHTPGTMLSEGLAVKQIDVPTPLGRTVKSLSWLVAFLGSSIVTQAWTILRLLVAAILGLKHVARCTRRYVAATVQYLLAGVGDDADALPTWLLVSFSPRCYGEPSADAMR